jgi:hypothetical protein
MRSTNPFGGDLRRAFRAFGRRAQVQIAEHAVSRPEAT